MHGCDAKATWRRTCTAILAMHGRDIWGGSRIPELNAVIFCPFSGQGSKNWVRYSKSKAVSCWVVLAPSRLGGVHSSCFMGAYLNGSTWSTGSRGTCVPHGMHKASNARAMDHSSHVFMQCALRDGWVCAVTPCFARAMLPSFDNPRCFLGGRGDTIRA